MIEEFIDPTRSRLVGQPPTRIIGFYLHYAKQVKGVLCALAVASLCVSLLDASIPWFIGRLVKYIAASPREHFILDHARFFIAMAAVVLVARPLAIAAQSLIANAGIAAGVTNLVRWQSHLYIVRQSWSFFQNDFAGRMAARIMETGPAVRYSAAAIVTAIWGIVVYGISAVVLLGNVTIWLTIPVMLWFCTYGGLLLTVVPRIRGESKNASLARSLLVGRIVDSYTNILTLKIFARERHEDGYVKEAVDLHTRSYRRELRMIFVLTTGLQVLNAALLASETALAVRLWQRGAVDVGAIAMAVPLTWQIASAAGWVATQVMDLFENMGTIQEGMKTIARPTALVDRRDAGELRVTHGEIRFEHVNFGYHEGSPVLEDFNVTIQPCEKIGVVGRSGAGKTTLVNLLLRLYDVDSGRITLDGQDIAAVTQDSLRFAIAVVAQDTSLLHRTIRENIAYGKPDASLDEVIAAAEQAHAHDFILNLTDWQGNRGYDARVGERGVKLSGGQRQRIAIARVILKNAPVVILDEATSALDSESEKAIQDSLASQMNGRTVIAIAHRLSTIKRMDRLIVMDRGRILQTGTHKQLIEQGGLYAALWAQQTGDLIDDTHVGPQ